MGCAQIQLNRGQVMGSTEVAQNNLDRGLLELERLGLARPPNVLLAEYLSALTAEEVLDVSGAEKISAAFNLVRYSAVAADDAQVDEGAAVLNRVAERLAALSPEKRTQISERVCARIYLVSGVRGSSTNRIPEGGPSIEAFRTPVTQIRQNPHQSVIDEAPESSFELSDRADGFVAALSPTARRRSGTPRVPLEFCALAILATFFVGYFFREAANKVVGAGSGDDREHAARPGFRSPDAWIGTVLAVGQGEVRAQHYGKARQALEFALSYSQHEDATTLNELAWSYVNPDEKGTTNPQRALDLITSALKLDRRPEFLDTAAEAHFQLGNFSEAIRLEQEALTRAAEGGGPALEQFLEKQLRKFDEGLRAHAATHPSAPRK
jgi:tetratricopeptide (TPR) repeat protein